MKHNRKASKQQIRYAWLLMRKSGDYTEEEMLNIVSDRTHRELIQIIDMLKDGEKIMVNVKNASKKQVRYVNYLMVQLGYHSSNHWDYDKVDVSISEADAYIKELEEELEEQQIMEDVLGHGQY